jgi:FixJ family two-component response regulator
MSGNPNTYGSDPAPDGSGLASGSAAPVVFFLDADAAVRDAVAAVLGASGMVVHLFAQATPFLEISLPAGPVCIVADHDVPPQGGLAVLRALADRKPRPGMVLMSGRLKPAIRSPIQQLLKPFGHDELVRAIGSALTTLPDPRDT